MEKKSFHIDPSLKIIIDLSVSAYICSCVFLNHFGNQIVLVIVKTMLNGYMKDTFAKWKVLSYVFLLLSYLSPFTQKYVTLWKHNKLWMTIYCDLG